MLEVNPGANFRHESGGEAPSCRELQAVFQTQASLTRGGWTYGLVLEILLGACGRRAFWIFLIPDSNLPWDGNRKFQLLMNNLGQFGRSVWTPAGRQTEPLSREYVAGPQTRQRTGSKSTCSFPWFCHLGIPHRRPVPGEIILQEGKEENY